MQRLFDHLCRYSHVDWISTVELLAANIHDVDRDATRIWFAFYPLKLHLALQAAPDKAAAQRKLGLMGKWELAGAIDASHRFLYAHRFWPQVKSAIGTTEEYPDSLAALITEVAERACRTARVDRDRLIGMAAVGLMTLRQTGVVAFAQAPGTVHLSDAARARSTHQVMQSRAKDDWQGPFGFMRGNRKR